MTRIHLVSLPHTLLTRDYDWCAYTAKVRRFVGMLATAGVHSVVYGPDVADDEVRSLCDEYVEIVTAADRKEWFGSEEWDNTRVFDRWDVNDPCWSISNDRAIWAISERWEPGDIVGIIGGACQQPIATWTHQQGGVVTEWGVGYSGVMSGTHKVYESYAWMHHVAGLRGQDDMQFFDTVIPNCFDPGDFTYNPDPGRYLLFMGRPNPRKGLPIVAEIAKRSDVPVLVAGQPGHDIPGTTYVGLVTGEEKAELLAKARAVLVPTTYLEPFGGVAVEAMMSGTPVIATDYGAFTETVIDGVTGYRCRMLSDFLDAVDQTCGIDRRGVRAHAVSRYSTAVGATQYGRYLRRLETLYSDGWYAPSDSAFQPWR